MAIRYLKIILVVFVGLQGLIYVASNITNWSHAIGAVGYVLGQTEHTVYPAHLAPAITNSVLVTLAFLLILAGELSVGVLSFKGAWDLYKVRHGTPTDFNNAKTFAMLGVGMAMVVWFGLFMVIGAALFQMWQTQVGTGSMEGAFMYMGSSALVGLFVHMDDR